MMKRIILLIVVCLCCFSACSQKDLPIEYKLDSVSATSVEDFLAKFSDVEIQATKGNALLYAVSSLNLNVESYEIRILEYIRWQNDDGEYWGSECIEVYWHPVDCSCPTDGGCNPIYLTLSYDPAGIDMVAVKKAMTKSKIRISMSKRFPLEKQRMCMWSMDNTGVVFLWKLKIRITMPLLDNCTFFARLSRHP